MPHPSYADRRPVEAGSNRFLAALPRGDFQSLAPHLRTLALERGLVLHEAGDPIEHVYFPHSGMISLVVVMQSGASVETMSVGRGGVVGAAAGLGSRSTVARGIVQLPGSFARVSSAQFAFATQQNKVIRDLVVRYNDLVIRQIQQSVACNALHSLDARLCRWLLQCHDCVDGNTIPLTQEFLGQMLGVRRTTVTIAARLLQSAGIIRYRRGVIQIADRRALEEAACECYRIISRQTDALFAGS